MKRNNKKNKTKRDNELDTKSKIYSEHYTEDIDSLLQFITSTSTTQDSASNNTNNKNSKNNKTVKQNQPPKTSNTTNTESAKQNKTKGKTVETKPAQKSNDQKQVAKKTETEQSQKSKPNDQRQSEAIKLNKNETTTTTVSKSSSSQKMAEVTVPKKIESKPLPPPMPVLAKEAEVPKLIQFIEDEEFAENLSTNMSGEFVTVKGRKLRKSTKKEQQVTAHPAPSINKNQTLHKNKDTKLINTNKSNVDSKPAQLVNQKPILSTASKAKENTNQLK